MERARRIQIISGILMTLFAVVGIWGSWYLLSSEDLVVPVVTPTLSSSDPNATPTPTDEPILPGTPSPTPAPLPPTATPEPILDRVLRSAAVFVPLGSLLFTCAGFFLSGLTFFVSTVFTLRTELREARKSQIELEKAQLELEKLRAERDARQDG